MLPSSLSDHDLRKLFALVLQDTWLFEGSIEQNIAYGNEKALKNEIVQAAKQANVHHFIRTLTDGYDTLIMKRVAIFLKVKNNY